MCLYLGICINFEANNANMQAFIDESLDHVLPKFRNGICKFLLNFSHFAKDFEQNI